MLQSYTRHLKDGVIRMHLFSEEASGLSSDNEKIPFYALLEGKRLSVVKLEYTQWIL